MNRHFLLLSCYLVALSIVSHCPSKARAEQISFEDFSLAAKVETFESLGPAPYLVTPLTIDNNVYRANHTLLDFSSKLGPEIGRIGTAIANRKSTIPGSSGFIDITLGEVALRAGMYLGSQNPNPWSLSVEFFDDNNSLLGSIGVSGIGKQNHFVAWKADVRRIARVRAIDASNVEHGVIIDDLITEVAEPTTLLSTVTVSVLILSNIRSR